MGERTQLLVNASFPTEKIKFGTVIHYQWGAGTTMLLDALNIIREIPPYTLLKYDDEEAKFKLLDKTLKTPDFGIRNPSLYRQLYKHIIGSTMNGGPNEFYDLDQLQDQLKKAKKKPSDKEDVEYNINESLCADADDFYLQCDNNDGYMLINIKYLNDHLIDIQVSFGAEPNPFAENSKREGTFRYMSLEHFCRQPVYRQDCDEDFQIGYRLLLRSLGVDFMDEESENRILEIKKQEREKSFKIL